MEGRNAKKAAQRCWQAALEHMENGDFRTAGALIGAVGRYVEQIHDEEGETLGQVIAFPAALALTQTEGSLRARDC